MLKEFFFQTNLTTLVTFLTLVHVMSFGIYKLKHQLLAAIIFLNYITEIGSSIILFFTRNEDQLGFLYSCNFIIHNALWLVILCGLAGYKNLLRIILPLFFIFGIVNIYHCHAYKTACYPFVLGTILYITIFSIYNYRQLKSENLGYFLSNDFLLLFTPLFFMAGLSLVVGFSENKIFKTIIFDDKDLYTLVVDYVNIIYYIGLNIYIFREKKVTYATV